MSSVMTPTPPWRILFLLAGLFATILATPDVGVAQEDELDRVVTRIAEGDYERARAEIAAWWEQVDAGRPAPGPHRARALLLRARLEPDPELAELDYLTLALTYPTAPEASEALLRLGQGLLATGDPARARAYLERLVNDHPSSPHRSVGALWLERARQADGTRETQLAGTGPAEGAGTVSGERTGTASGERTGAAPSERTGTPPSERTGAEPGGRRAAPPADADGRFAVQSGAFRQREGALDLAERLRRAGHEPRLVGLPGSSLVRVRVGRFVDRDAARILARRLLADGFEAFVVADAERERPVR